jgi:hypothetical protein
MNNLKAADTIPFDLLARAKEQMLKFSDEPKRIDDVRDIEIKIMNAYCPASVVLRPFVGKYKLRNYRGPIEYITAQCDGKTFAIEIGLHVVDATQNIPVHLTVQKRYSQEILCSSLSAREWFENAIREAILWSTTHEIDESLVRDGEFVIDPHPERKQ